MGRIGINEIFSICRKIIFNDNIEDKIVLLSNLPSLIKISKEDGQSFLGTVEKSPVEDQRATELKQTSQPNVVPSLLFDKIGKSAWLSGENTAGNYIPNDLALP